MSETFGPRVVEHGAKKRWFREARVLWKSSWSGMVPMALTLGLLVALFNNTEPMRSVGYFVLLPLLSLMWQVSMVKITNLTAEGKRVGFLDVCRSYLQIFKIPKFFWVALFKRFTYVILAALFGILLVTMSFYLSGKTPEEVAVSKSLFFEGNLLLTKIYQVGNGWGLFLAMTWILNPSGPFSFVNILAIEKGLCYKEASVLDNLGFSKNPFMENVGMSFLQIAMLSMLVSIVPFLFILVVLLETFGSCYLVVAYRDVFNQGGLKELEKEEALIKNANAVPNL